MKTVCKAAVFVLSFCVTLFAVSHVQGLDVITTWSSEKVQALQEFHSNRTQGVNIQWHSLSSSPDATQHVLDIVSKGSGVAIVSDDPSLFCFLKEGPSHLVIKGMGFPAEDKNSPFLGFGSTSEGDTYYETVNPFFLISPARMQHHKELYAVEHVLSEYGATLTPSSPWWGHAFDYKRFENQAKVTEHGSLRGYQALLASKGCRCGPSSSCKSLKQLEFAEFLMSKKKPRCPRNPGCGPSSSCKSLKQPNLQSF